MLRSKSGIEQRSGWWEANVADLPALAAKLLALPTSDKLRAAAELVDNVRDVELVVVELATCRAARAA